LLGWATSAAIGGFVFGYQVGVISGALLSIRRDFGLSDFEQGALVSILPLGAMAGGLLTVRLADTLGRLPLAAAIGQGPAFWLFACVCAAGLLFVHRYVPETKGRTFTEIDADVRDRWGRHHAPRAAAS
jgi:predicted MFS family arabinose efflux permease